MTPRPIRPDVHRRFRAVVARAIDRADREQAAELAKIGFYRRRSWVDVRDALPVSRHADEER